jgi:putative colanic acid biosynthesis UDP-glucose lipid carrier transferase
MQARVNYDLDYLRYWTPMLDIKILFLTIFKVFRDEKAY